MCQHVYLCLDVYSICPSVHQSIYSSLRGYTALTENFTQTTRLILGFSLCMSVTPFSHRRNTDPIIRNLLIKRVVSSLLLPMPLPRLPARLPISSRPLPLRSQCRRLLYSFLCETVLVATATRLKRSPHPPSFTAHTKLLLPRHGHPHEFSLFSAWAPPLCAKVPECPHTHLP